MKAQYKKELTGLFCITAPIVLFFVRFLYPVTQLFITPDFGQSDAVTSFTTKFFLAQQLHAGKLPLWSSQIGGGFPVYAGGGVGMWYIPNALLFSLISAPEAYVYSLMISLLLLGWGTYIWLRLIGTTRIASIFGGICIALSGYPIVQFTHLTILQSISLFPMIMAGIVVIVQKRSRTYMVLTALLYAQLICIGFAQSIFITTLFAFCYALWLLRKLPNRLGIAALLSGAGILGILLSAVQLLPSLEFMKQLDSSGKFTPEQSTLFSYPFKHLITLFDPYLLGNPATGTYPHFFIFNGSIFWENTAYAGIIPALLLCVYLISLLKKRTVHLDFFLLAFVCSFFFMTGKNSPVYFIFSFFPFTLFRVPSRFIWLFIVSYIFIITRVFQSLLTKITDIRTKALIGVFIIVISVYNSFFIWSPYHNTEPAGEWLKNPSLLQYMNTEGYTLTIGGERAYNTVYIERGWTRTNPDDRPSYVLRNTFTPDKNSLWGVSQIRDYAGRELRRSKILQDLLDQSIKTTDGYATISAFGSKLLNLYGISNVISTLHLTHKTLAERAALTDLHVQITAYSNPNVLPREYFATKPLYVRTVSEATRALLDDAFIPGVSALVERPIPNIGASTGSATISNISRSHSESLYRVDGVASDMLLVIAQNYYPGWKMTIDGKPTLVFPINITQTGAIIPKGSHTVGLYYLPESLMYGALISMLTLLSIIIVAVWLHSGRGVPYILQTEKPQQ